MTPPRPDVAIGEQHADQAHDDQVDGDLQGRKGTLPSGKNHREQQDEAEDPRIAKARTMLTKWLRGCGSGCLSRGTMTSKWTP